MTYSPDYYAGFRCSAADCPDPCCKAGWLIPIDSETAAAYRAVDPHFDENSYTDEEGDLVFKLRRDRSCPYFRDDGLCELYIRTGGRLCEICDKYPRFFEEYDGFAEAGISLSCPTAGEIILNRADNPYKNLGRTSPDRLLLFLTRARERAIGLIYSETDPDDAARIILGYGADLQELIDFDELDSLDGLEFSPYDIIGESEISRLKSFIAEKTEVLDPRWSALLCEKTGRGGTALMRRSFLGYLTYRHFLKAINSEDIFTETAYIAALYFLGTSLGDDLLTSAMLLSRELEHNGENERAAKDFVAGLL